MIGAPWLAAGAFALAAAIMGGLWQHERAAHANTRAAVATERATLEAQAAARLQAAAERSAAALTAAAAADAKDAAALAAVRSELRRANHATNLVAGQCHALRALVRGLRPDGAGPAVGLPPGTGPAAALPHGAAAPHAPVTGR